MQWTKENQEYKERTTNKIKYENYKDYIGLQKKINELNNLNVILYPSPVVDINKDIENNVSDNMTFDEFEKYDGEIGKEGMTTASTTVLDDRNC